MRYTKAMQEQWRRNSELISYWASEARRLEAQLSKVDEYAQYVSAATQRGEQFKAFAEWYAEQPPQVPA